MCTKFLYLTMKHHNNYGCYQSVCSLRGVCMLYAFIYVHDIYSSILLQEWMGGGGQGK